jgi:hypothetical protein
MVKTQNRFHNLENKKFNRLLVLKRDWEKTSKENGWKVYWVCKCDCGNIVSVRGESLKTNTTKSCGCLQKETVRECGKNNRLPSGEYAKRCIFHNYEKRSKKKNIKFTLSRAEFDLIISQNCHYCNSAPSNIYRYKNRDWVYFKYNGIDRKNPKMGYEPNNIVPCCGDCNYMKLDLEYNIFIDKIKKIKDHMGI